MTNNFAQSIARAIGTTTSLESVDVDINIGQDAIVDEDGAVVSPVAPLTDEPIAEAQETQLAEDSADVADIDNAINDGEDDIETLESITLKLQSALDNGGLDTVSYEMLNITMGHVYRKYGISVDNVMPSMEDFGDNRYEQTQLSMEKVTDTLKSVKSSVGDFLAKLWFRIKEFVKNIIQLNFTLEKRVRAIRAAAASKEMANKVPKEITLYSAKKLTINGKLPARDALIAAANKAVAGGGILSALTGYMGDVASSLTDALQHPDVLKGDKLKGELESKFKNVASMTNAMPFQDVKFVTTTFGAKGEGKSLLPGLKLETKTVEGELNNKIMGLNAQQVVDMIDKNILPLCRAFEKAKNDNHKAFERTILNIAEDTKQGHGEIKANAEIKRYIKEVMNYHAKTYTYLHGINKALIDYCAQSVSSLKGGKDDTGANAKVPGTGVVAA